MKDLRDLPAYPSFIAPRIVAFADDPGQYCCRKEKCPMRKTYPGSYGKDTCQCRESIGRYPVLKTSYFDTHIYLLEYGACPF